MVTQTLLRIAAALVLVALATSTHAQLQGRDLNEDGKPDAFYDVAQNITWLADANYAASSGYWESHSFDALTHYEPGRMAQAEASSWVAQLDFYGITGWRLPTLLAAPGVVSWLGAPAGTACSELSSGRLCTVGRNEMSLLFDASNGYLSNFDNVQSEYWTGYTFADNQSKEWFVHSDQGVSGINDEPLNAVFAWAVHDGDIASPAPEPASAWLLLVGLVAVGAAIWRRKTRPTVS